MSTVETAMAHRPDRADQRLGSTAGRVLSVPVNFMHGDMERWRDVAAPEGRRFTADMLAPRIRLGREIWIVQAFLELRRRGYDVSLTGSSRADAINVVHRDDIACVSDPVNHFTVCVRADRDPAFISHFEIVQNLWSLWSPTDLYVPHWPQPGLLPRDETRGDRIENVVFFGKDENLAPELRDDAFRAQLRARGMQLQLKGDDWWDYRATDVVLAVRSGEPFYLDIKPASKLVNAWLAGCPAILSPERGYDELRRSDLDYLQATNAGEVLAALDLLRAEPQRYARMIQNGRVRAVAYTHDAVADEWELALIGPIQAGYRRWAARPSPLARLTRYAAARVRRRLWGTQAVQWKKAPLHSFIYRLRRAFILPRSA